MSILCGIDFSETSQAALRVAEHLARTQNVPLHIVHALPVGREDIAQPGHDVARWAERLLEQAAEQAGDRGVVVSTHLRTAAPDEALIDFAAEQGVELIVVGALGHRTKRHWNLGSHADRLAQRSRVPVLVVRQSAPFEAWLSRSRPLRVVLGADFSRSTDCAMGKLEELRKLAPCDVSAVHLYWPPQQFERLGLEGVRSYLDPDPEVTKTLVRDLTQRLAPADNPGSLEVYAEPHLGRRGDRLAAIASERDADLLVVGTHERSPLGRVWEGSVARWALHASDRSVLCVPLQPMAAAAKAAVPRVRNVLAATDFSEAGNAAVALAFAIAEPGATVSLAHVVPETHAKPLEPHDLFALEQSAADDPRRSEVHGALTALIPPDRRALTRVYALESNTPAAAICQAAARVNAEVVCVGHRGRSKLAKTLLGSVATDVLARAERPVLIAPAPKE